MELKTSKNWNKVASLNQWSIWRLLLIRTDFSYQNIWYNIILQNWLNTLTRSDNIYNENLILP